MTPAEIMHRQKQLAAELTAIERQLEPIAELRTLPGRLGPAEVEQGLLDRWTEIEDAFRVLWYVQQCGELPPGYER